MNVIYHAGAEQCHAQVRQEVMVYVEVEVEACHY